VSDRDRACDATAFDLRGDSSAGVDFLVEERDRGAQRR
jgi:hypothetical protein